MNTKNRIDEEYDHEAQANSDGLVTLETVAMNAVKGRFADGRGGFTNVGPPALEIL